MARKRSRSQRSESDFSTSSDPLLREIMAPVLGSPWVTPSWRNLEDLRELEDRRQFHPEGEYRPARALVDDAARIVDSPPPDGRAAPADRAFIPSDRAGAAEFQGASEGGYLCSS